MPVCIYCASQKTAKNFSKEHVLPRAFCGEGKNWTLIDTVCSECNNLFSTFESHWTRNTIESIMRNFSGPGSRRRKSVRRRTQTTEIDHLYIIQKNDPIVFEAGFAFHNDFYFRPQIIQTDDGLVELAGDREDIEPFQSEISKLKNLQMFKLSRPIDGEEKQMFRTVTLAKDIASKSYSICFEKDESCFSDYRIRSYPESPVGREFDGIKRHLTPRCALDDRKRIYFRANRESEIAELMSNLLQEKKACPPTHSHDQNIVLSVRAKLPMVFRAVLKTGLNMVAHLAGASLARDSAFDKIREILLDKNADQDVMERCQFLDTNEVTSYRADFPTQGTSEQHRLMLDLFRENLCFRIQLYGGLGYEGILAVATPNLQSAITTARVVVDFNKNGIREVSNWS